MAVKVLPQISPHEQAFHLVRCNKERAFLEVPLKKVKPLYDLFPEMVKYIKKVAKPLTPTFHLTLPAANKILVPLPFELYVLLKALEQMKPYWDDDPDEHEKKVSDAIGMLEYVCDHSAEFGDQLMEFLEKGDINPKLINTLREIKKYLLACNVHFNQLLFNYTQAPSIDIPRIDEVRLNINKVKDLIKGLKAEQLQKLYKPNEITTDHIVCSILGLDSSITKRFEKYSAEVRQHQPDEYLLLELLEDRFETLLQLEDFDGRISEKNFTKLGFRESKSEILTSILKKNPLRDHQSLIYWAKHFIRDAFEYDILLNNANSTRFRMDRTPHNIHFSPMDMMEEKSPDAAPVDEKISWFHGTDLKSALHMANNGIHLNEGNREQDFSNGLGFYLTDDPKTAIEWATRYHFCPYNALVEFSISRDVIESFECLDISTNEDTWNEVVAYNRSGRDRSVYEPSSSTRQAYHAADYVKGKVCANGGLYWTSDDIELQPGNEDEICILSQEMSYALFEKADITIHFGVINN